MRIFNVKPFSYAVFPFLLSSLFFSPSSNAKILCVDANATVNGKEDGSCWKRPYLDLQKALEAAKTDKSVNQIWIADGVYKPSKTYSPTNKYGQEITAGALSLPENNPGLTCADVTLNYADNVAEFNRKLITFDLVDGVSLYGGFQGQNRGETSLATRASNPLLYPTILDGNLGDDNNPDNVWHVLTAGNDITIQGVKLDLDRITVRNGNAEDAPYFPINFYLNPGQVPIHYHDDGGGLYVFIKSDIKINHATFTQNKSCAGGALFAHDGSKIEIVNSQFLDNTALNGGAMTVRGGGPSEIADPDGRKTTLTISKTFFNRNSSYFGTAILLDDNLGGNAPPGKTGVDATLSENQFIDNPSADNEFEASTIAAYSGSLKLFKSLFNDHHAMASQSLFYFPTAEGIFNISNNQFLNQNAVAFPGAVMQIIGGINSVIANNVFKDNHSATDGGGLWLCCGSDLVVKNNLFEGNSADNKGGGAIFTFGQTLDLLNNRFINNSAPGGGGAILLDATNGAVINKDNNTTYEANTPNNLRTE